MFRRRDAKLLDLYWSSCAEEIPRYKVTDDDRLEGEYELGDWIDLVEHLHLQVKDLTTKPIDLLLLDRNVYDLASYNEGKDALVPEKFFKHNYRILYKPTSEDNLLVGTALWKEDFEEKIFRFHIDLGDYWYPLNDKGNVPTHLWGNLRDGKMSKPDNRIGWRGPSIQWSLLSHCPKVVYSS